MFHIPYPPARTGFWSPVTSTLNWCEEDYYATIYFAEIVNSLTNALFLFLGVKGIISCRKNGHDFIFQIAFIGYFIVGLGSLLFHSTLKYPMQLVDELSMIYTTCLMCYATFSFSKSTKARAILGSSLLGLSIFITAYYHYLQDPRFHQNAYAILTVVVVLRSMWLMEVTLRSKWRKARALSASAHVNGGSNPCSSRDVQLSQNTRDLKILNTMWFMVVFGLTSFLTGFLIWNLDNHYCSTFRGWRRRIGLPWGIVLEGHGWWHLLTGTGAYIYIIWGIWLRHCLNGRQDEYELYWPRFYNWPDVVRVEKEIPKPVHLNGTAAIKTH
ncbi:Alkaline phytoceramidase family protein [Coccidioides posadasii C735 delta SOWgp]|uniref:Alkaline phytoceramidase family protein n=1 Tax=Coccidioides posadasii (strain C735) TaxID=222929 RepID=C5P5T7_COCP7|nr:Alkaline phytoceramidase family protein [Coccidioides posadasii C735 delta SOWgp]EER28077.1 Alkaline phytoceramidase family protein [Coccidioides posadasii C735 delta SOWgp]|eukprot:XP_003070222.1 Alkaline phytoceramidase family protein [Coccidioides posadasii C735 delta SOWgp]